MAFLNAQEREALLQELKQKKFGAAKWKLSHLDPKGRLAYFRNNQEVGKWLTRYELPTLGTRVTLVETYDTKQKGGHNKVDFQFVDVIVEPTADNKS
jgi:hypothetical protein